MNITIDELRELIKKTRNGALEEAAEVVEQGTSEAVKTTTLEILKTERARISAAIKSMKE